jgi:hypothetical protein
MSEPIGILLVEDNAEDVEVVLRAFRPAVRPERRPSLAQADPRGTYTSGPPPARSIV